MDRNRIIATMGDLKVNADIKSTLLALDILTPVEFRNWLEHCKVYDNFHPSHFQGTEEAYVTTGSWEVK